MLPPEAQTRNSIGRNSWRELPLQTRFVFRAIRTRGERNHSAQHSSFLPVFRIFCFWSELLPMDSGSTQTRISKRARKQSAGRPVAASTRRGAEARAETEGKPAMQRETRSRRLEAVRAHPVAELLECPPEIVLLLNRSAQCLSFEAGEAVFHQSGICRGLYLVITGQFLRRAERLKDAVDAGSGPRRGSGGAGCRAGRQASHLHASCADRRISSHAAYGSAQPGVSELSTPTDAVAGGTGPRGFPRL